MQFIHQPLTWGFFLVLLPLLIHLINLMRQRRVEWAAMEFLLEAYKKRRNSIWLKQLLLLLTRMFVIAATVAMLAKLVTRDQWSSLLGGKTTHHYVLLDDSLSMGERLGGGTAFDRAVHATGQLIGRISDRADQGGVRFTLLRYSRAIDPARGSASATSATSADASGIESSSVGAAAPTDPGKQGADFNSVVVDQDLQSRWAEHQGRFKVSELAVGPEAALDLISQRISERDGEQPIVYVMSDFRADVWDAPRAIGLELTRLDDAGAAVRLVRCVESDQGNLAVVGVRPVDGVHAAGVPLYVEVSVHNYGDAPVSQVPVSLSTTYYPSADSPVDCRGTSETLPDLLFDSIAPGQTVNRRAQVFFPTTGQHVVHAQLPADALAADNLRRCVVDLPDSVPVLVIDQDPERRNAAFLSTVFRPSQRVETGIQPVVESPAYLRDAIPEELAKFASIYILDCESLDEPSVRRLEAYVQNGGGLGFFMGPASRSRFYQEWYGDGTGLFPVPLQKMDLLEPSTDDAPDLVVEDHPLFRMLMGQRNSFLGRIRIGQYHMTRFGWQPPVASEIRVIARLRNGQPLVVERTFGRGRVVATLTTLAPTWNTWAMEPTFVVFLLELQAYLQQPKMAAEGETLVGRPIEFIWDQSEYQRDVVLTYSPDRGASRADGSAASVQDRSARLVKTRVVEANGTIRWGSLTDDSQTTEQSGLYETWLAGHDGVYGVDRQAVNVDPVESDLAIASSETMVESLPTKHLQMLSAADLAETAATPQTFSLAQSLLVGLVILLLVEQLLSYSASYHPARNRRMGSNSRTPGNHQPTRGRSVLRPPVADSGGVGR